MATFIVKYRTRTGAMAEDVIESESRSAAFSVLKEKGITPVSLTEGTRVKTAGPKRKADGTRKSLASVWIVLVAVAVVLPLTWWIAAKGSVTLPSGEGPSQGQSKVAHLPEKTPDDGTRENIARNTGGTKSLTVQNVATNNSGLDAKAPQIPVAGTNLPPPSLPPPPPQTFDHASDQLIAMAITAGDHGMAPMPMSRDTEQEFLNSLKKEIVILDTDDDQTKALKEAVMSTREEIKKLMDQGQSFAQIMKGHQKLANENVQIRNNATLEIKRLLDAGDVEGAKKYKRKINETLTQMGISALSIPVTEEERKERAAARRERMLEKRARQAAEAERAAALRKAQEAK